MSKLTGTLCVLFWSRTGWAIELRVGMNRTFSFLVGWGRRGVFIGSDIAEYFVDLNVVHVLGLVFL
jgi:hypothetical protein